MKRKIESASQEPVNRDKCQHYWIIESPRGQTSRGVCKICGAERQFYNSWPFFPMGRPDESRTGTESPEPKEPTGEEARSEEDSNVEA